MKVVALALSIWPTIGFATEPIFPNTEGTIWNYELVQERPSDSLDLTAPNEKEHFAVTYRLGGAERVENKDLQRLEIYRGNALESVDLIAIEERGIICPARANAEGVLTKLIPPQQMLALPLQSGTGWTFYGMIGDTKVRQRYQIMGEEDVLVPAGKFRAWRIRCGQILPVPVTIDRWFVPGIGFVKVDTTLKGRAGTILQKTSLRLKERPKVGQALQPQTTSQKLAAGVSSEPNGEFKTEFKSDIPAIYARWHGHELREQAAIRAAFIAENVAEVAADFEIDESEAIAPSPDSGATFTLSKPKGGWTPGSYRVEFFVDNEPAAAVRFKISK